MSPRAVLFQSAVARAKKAKARLTNMVVQEVSGVDVPANGRRWVIVKRDDSMTTRVSKVALRLPAAAKQGIMDGLGQVLDKITALATMTGDAEEDDTAAVPPDLGMALKECASMLASLADQYAPAGAPPADGAQPPPNPDDPAAGKAMPPLPPGQTAPRPDQQPLGKALPAPQTTSLNLAQEEHDSLTMQPKTMAAVAELFKALGDEIADVAKAGRKIKGDRYRKLSDLHVSLGGLLNELAYDEATGSEDTTKRAAVTPVAKSARELDLESKLAKANAIIAKAGAVDAPAARVPEGGPPAVKVAWPLDMSADLAKRKRATR